MEQQLTFKSTGSYSRKTYFVRIGAVALLLLLAQWLMPYLTFFGEYDQAMGWWLALVIFLLISAFLLTEHIYTEVHFDLSRQEVTTRRITPWKAEEVQTAPLASVRYNWKKENRAMGRSVMVLKMTSGGKTLFKVTGGFNGFSVETLEAIVNQLVVLQVAKL